MPGGVAFISQFSFAFSPKLSQPKVLDGKQSMTSSTTEKLIAEPIEKSANSTVLLVEDNADHAALVMRHFRQDVGAYWLGWNHCA